MTASASQFKLVPTLRRVMRKVIAVDPRTIELVPHTKTRQPGGGWKLEAQTPRAPQTFMLEYQPGMTTGIVSGMEGAESRSWSYQLVGEWDSVVEVDDIWQDGETTYRIVAIMPKNDYEKRCVVEASGPDPNYGP